MGPGKAGYLQLNGLRKILSWMEAAMFKLELSYTDILKRAAVLFWLFFFKYNYFPVDSLFAGGFDCYYPGKAGGAAG